MGVAERVRTSTPLASAYRKEGGREGGREGKEGRREEKVTGVKEGAREGGRARRTLSFSFCETPRRCSSSTTTRPRFLNRTFLPVTDVVPTTT